MRSDVISCSEGSSNRYGKYIDPVIKLGTWPLRKLMEDQMKVFEDKKV